MNTKQFMKTVNYFILSIYRFENVSVKSKNIFSRRDLAKARFTQNHGFVGVHSGTFWFNWHESHCFTYFLFLISSNKGHQK